MLLLIWIWSIINRLESSWRNIWQLSIPGWSTSNEKGSSSSKLLALWMNQSFGGAIHHQKQYLGTIWQESANNQSFGEAIHHQKQYLETIWQESATNQSFGEAIHHQKQYLETTWQEWISDRLQQVLSSNTCQTTNYREYNERYDVQYCAIIQSERNIPCSHKTKHK